MRTNEELATAIQNGENELMDQLWRQCYGFIRQQATRWARAWESRPDFDIDDLTQAGYIALCEAVRGFEEDRGTFIGFLAFYLKIEFSKVAGCRTKAQLKEPLNYALSLDAPAYNGDGCEMVLGDTIPVNDNGIEDVEKELTNQHLARVLDQALQSLPVSHRQAIELHYLHGLPYIKAAEVMGCSASSPHQFAKEGFKRIRKGRYGPVLYEMLYGDRNYYKGTGLATYKHTGMSAPEREVLYMEYIEGRYRAADWLGKVNLLVDRLGYGMEKARLFATQDSILV